MAARRIFTLPEAARAFGLLPRILQDAIIEGGNEGMAYMVRVITSSPIMRNMGPTQAPNAPPGPLAIRSGALAASVSFTPFYRQGNEIRGGHITVGVPYGMIQERGGIIHHPGSVAKPGGVLHWKGKAGNDVFATSTRPHIIRIPPRPYMKPGAERALPVFSRIVDTRIGDRFDATFGS